MKHVHSQNQDGRVQSGPLHDIRVWFNWDLTAGMISLGMQSIRTDAQVPKECNMWDGFYNGLFCNSDTCHTYTVYSTPVGHVKHYRTRTSLDSKKWHRTDSCFWQLIFTNTNHSWNSLPRDIIAQLTIKQPNKHCTAVPSMFGIIISTYPLHQKWDARPGWIISSRTPCPLHYRARCQCFQSPTSNTYHRLSSTNISGTFHHGSLNFPDAKVQHCKPLSRFLFIRGSNEQQSGTVQSFKS